MAVEVGVSVVCVGAPAVPVAVGVSVTVDVGVSVGVGVTVGVTVTVGVDVAIRERIEGMIAADSGQLSNQDWISLMSIG